MAKKAVDSVEAPDLGAVLEERGFRPAPEEPAPEGERAKLLADALRHYKLDAVLRVIYPKPGVVKLIVGDGRKLWYPEAATPFRPSNAQPAKTRSLLDGLKADSDQ